MVSAVVAFIGLPFLLTGSAFAGDLDAFIFAYILIFILLVSLSLKVVSFLALTFHDKMYVAVVVGALEFLIWDGFSHVLGVPQLALNFEADKIKIDLLSSQSDFNAIPVWICLIATAALYSLARQLIDKE